MQIFYNQKSSALYCQNIGFYYRSNADLLHLHQSKKGCSDHVGVNVLI